MFRSVIWVFYEKHIPQSCGFHIIAFLERKLWKNSIKRKRGERIIREEIRVQG